jgi:flagellar basal body P-ring formation protein FlgA
MVWRSICKLALVTAIAMAAWTGAAMAQEIVFIPNRVIYPGETITMDALKEVTLKPGKIIPPAVAIAPIELDGKIAVRTLLPGRYIQANGIREPWVVERGASVQMIFVSGGLTISAAAITLQPGAAGDFVKVRNVDSGKVLTGTVMADGSIRVSAS